MSGKMACCSICPKENQQIEAVIKLPEEKRAVIQGTVIDCKGNPVADAVVKLFQIGEGCKLPCPLTHTFTDDNGQFLLGPLCPNTTYMLKIFSDNTQIVQKCLKVNCYKGSCLNVNTVSNDSNNQGCRC